ncbi:MAG: hypothetical protein J6B09_06185 [Clostridia bacterium]|nr:hypothetical protein [Clostridia bacterium]
MIYTKEHLQEISFPLGGIGSGCIGLAGNGRLIEWEICNRPSKGTHNPYSFFAIRAEYPNGKVVCKVLQGDLDKNLAGNGHGYPSDSMSAMPHFEQVVFDGRFPIAELSFTDPDFPAEVKLTAFNPFIPHNAKDSSLPAAFFNISVKSLEQGVRYTLVLSAKNFFEQPENLNGSHDGITAVTLQRAELDLSKKDHGDLTLATDAGNGFIQQYWYHGRWQDGVTTFWHEFMTDTLENRVYPVGDPASKGEIGLIGAKATIGKGESHDFRFVIAWNVPNCYNYWKPYQTEEGEDILWKNYYATVFETSGDTAAYALKHFDTLYGKTATFRDTLHHSTLDPAAIDAISSTLSVLKSPTVLRLEDGTFYGWEGVNNKKGSCEGTCTHVWSYAYALCFLFPELERSIRETEFKYDTDENGRMCFRTELPLGRGIGKFRACVDGQMASVFKSYREWKISGDDAWLKAHWQTIKLLLSYAWSEANPDEWDRNCDGVLEGRQHHTLDMELFGPSAWLQGMYLAALRAGEEMALYLQDTDAAAEYRKLFEKGYRYTKNELFNGKYYIQKVDIKDKGYTEHFDCANYWNDEKGELKYQIGEGCAIDQLLGQWHASLCGLGDVFDKEQRRTALQSMLANNFKKSFRNFANPWRIYVINDEAGAIMCDYPDGAERPILPIPYESECMTGFEYAFAGLLVSEGFIDEGLQLVRAIRDRYDGKKRNPWNEIECGSNYARAMASFALIPVFSGFTFDMPHKHIGFSPIAKGDFRCIWSVANAWGNYEDNGTEIALTLHGGDIALSSITLGAMTSAKALYIDGKPIDFTIDNHTLSFTETTIKKELRVIR